MKSYKPEELFDENGTLIGRLAELAPEGERRMSANPHANGGLLLRDLNLPDFRDYGVTVPKPGMCRCGSNASPREFPSRRDEAELRIAQFPRVGPG